MMEKLAEFDPPVGVAEELEPNLRRLLAPNPSPMTFRGTNTYIVGDTELAVIDPGPDHDGHLAAILSAVGPKQKITHIFVTHAHLDHSPLARRLSDQTGASVYAFGDAKAGQSGVMKALAAEGLAGGGEGVDATFQPDQLLSDGQVVEGAGWSLTSIWTPGHFGNHLCFALGDVVFSGDLVMDWATSLVSPPDGDLTDFIESCKKLKTFGARVLFPGHGDVVEQPQDRVDWLIAHRMGREAQILTALSKGAFTAAALAEQIYTETPTALLPAATRNVFAHLIDLHEKKVVSAHPKLSAEAVFALR